MECRSEGEGLGGSGFVSEQRRWPRSKVYGIGLVTVTDGFLDDPLRSICDVASAISVSVIVLIVVVEEGELVCGVQRNSWC